MINLICPRTKDKTRQRRNGAIEDRNVHCLGTGILKETVSQTRFKLGQNEKKGGWES